jgi:hypothetical protein
MHCSAPAVTHHGENGGATRWRQGGMRHEKAERMSWRGASALFEMVFSTLKI